MDLASCAILLDTGVLGLVTHPSNSPEPASCKRWFEARLQDGFRFYVPEIADYEPRRKLLHLDSKITLMRLDRLKSVIHYLPITTAAMLKAAELWAGARRSGLPTAPEAALDADVILAAQAAVLNGAGEPEGALVVTDNVGHLDRFVAARRWRDIPEAHGP